LAIVGVMAVLSAGDRGQVGARQAVLTFMYGDVQVRHGTGGYKAAKLNEALKSGDAIKTGADARAELSLGAGGYVRLDESSHLLITHLQEGGTTSFQALLGGVWVTIEKALSGGGGFEVRMPSAVASVKGTVFRCEVDEEGGSSTYVYDGSVEIQAGNETTKITPAQYARIARGRKIAMGQMNLDDDDKRAWVQHNRQRDILRHLGNPRIMVALTDGDEMGKKAALAASLALAKSLRRQGFVGASVAQKDLANISFDENDWIQWREKTDNDYFVVGKAVAGQVRQIDGGKFSARAHGGAYLVPAGSRRHIAKATSSVRGDGEGEREAVLSAFNALGTRLAEELAPAIMREIMEERQGAVRVEISGLSNRTQIFLLRAMVSRLDGVVRVTPLRAVGGTLALAVAGDIEPAKLAAVLRQSEAIQEVHLSGRVVRAKLKPIPGQQRPQPQARPQRPGRAAVGHEPPGGRLGPAWRKPQK